MNKIPQMIWAQNKTDVFLTLNVINSSNLETSYNNNLLNINVTLDSGVCKLSIPLFSRISDYTYRNMERQIFFILKKEEMSWWVRFTDDPKYKSFIRIDWNRWCSESDDELSSVKNYDEEDDEDDADYADDEEDEEDEEDDEDDEDNEDNEDDVDDNEEDDEDNDKDYVTNLNTNISNNMCDTKLVTCN